MSRDFSNAVVDSYLAQLSVRGRSGGGGTRGTDTPQSERRALDAIVVGAGVGGLTTASVLAQSGLRVLALERSPHCGGSTHGFEEAGYRFEMGLQDVGCRVWEGMNGDNGSRVLHAASRGGVEWKRVERASHCVVVGDLHFTVRGTWAEFREDLVAMFPAEREAVDKYREQVVRVQQLAAHYIMSRIRPEGAPPLPPLEFAPSASGSAVNSATTSENSCSGSSTPSSSIAATVVDDGRSGLDVILMIIATTM